MSTTNELPTNRALPQKSEPVNLGRHQRRCTVCNHPDRAHIEQDFIDWRNPWDIAEDYEISDRSSIYRHAHALGLFRHRKTNLRFVLENLLERGDEVEVTAGSIVRAVRAYTRVTDDGQWIDPPTRVVISHVSANPTEEVPSTPHPNGEPALKSGRKVLKAASPDLREFAEGDPEKQPFLTATEDHSPEESTRGKQRR